MLTNIKWIVLIIVLSGCTALFIWGDRIQPGSVFAGLATFIAALKSKLLGITSFQKMISEIESSHQLKRDEWESEKRDYDRQYDLLKLRLDSLDNRTEILKEQLRQASQKDYQPQRRTEEEIREWLMRK